MSEVCAIGGYGRDGEPRHAEPQPIICLNCHLRLAANLTWITRNYKMLADHLAPQGTTSEVHTVPASKPPLRTDVLSLEAKGGITGILGSWVQLLVEDRQADPPNYRLRQEALVHAQGQVIKAHLSWLVEQEFAEEIYAEIRDLRQDIETLLGEVERTWIPVGWKCPVVLPDADQPCGTKLKQRRGQWLIRCKGCESEWVGEQEFERLGRMLGCEYEVTIDQAARLARVGRSTIHRWIQVELLPATVVDGVRIVDTRDLALVIARRSA